MIPRRSLLVGERKGGWIYKAVKAYMKAQRIALKRAAMKNKPVHKQ